jgi:hypothetical protein
MEEQSKGKGRPKKDPAKHKRNRTLSLTDDEYTKLRSLAAAADKEVSEFVIDSFGLDKP